MNWVETLKKCALIVQEIGMHIIITSKFELKLAGYTMARITAYLYLTELTILIPFSCATNTVETNQVCAGVTR